jgi:glutamate/tyrosine decarboxylase-like PLP-dependent enzyme
MERLALDRHHVGHLLRSTVDLAVDVLRDLDERPVGRNVPAIAPLGLPAQGIGASAALEVLAARYAPYFSGSAGPRYFGFVTGGSTPAALMGDWLTSTYDQNLADAGESSSRQLTLDALGMVRELVGLPASYVGAFVTGATASSTVALAIARQWVGRKRNVDVATEGVHALGPVAVLSGTAHSSISKALAVIGLGRRALRSVPTLRDREAVDVDALEEMLANGTGPAIVVANAGTVNTCDFDDLVRIAALRERYEFWLHVDGAFGAIAGASPSFRHLLAGLEACDSLTVDAHKWLNVPYDCGVVFTRHHDLHGEVFRNASAYLPTQVEVDTFVHLTPENSQRVRALPVWMTLAAYGRDGYAAIVERSCAHARWLGEQLATDARFKLLAPVRLNGVVFALLDATGESRSAEQTAAFLAELRREGTVFLTPTRYRGHAAARVSMTNWRTERVDVERSWAAIQRAASTLEV